MDSALDPVRQIASPQAQTQGSTKCSVCADPRLADINATLLSKGVRAACRAFDIPLGSMSRHYQNHAQANGTPPGTMGPNSPTARRAKRLANRAEKHLKALQNATGSDIDAKAVNGAITAADKAFRLEGEAIGTLKSGTRIDLNVTAEAKVAMAAHEQALTMPLRDVLTEAAAILDAQVLAGDAHACALVAKLASRLVEPAATA